MGFIKLTLFLIVGLSSVPETMIDNISCEECECRIWNNLLDGLVQAQLQAHGSVAFMISIGPSRRLGKSRRIILGIRSCL